MKLYKNIYLDGAANTPVDPSVWKIIKKYTRPNFVGNSMSIHNKGAVANMLVYNARENIAKDLHVGINEVFFTSGATEGNNWVIKSIATQQVRKHSPRNKIICSATEHDSVLRCCEQVEGLGLEVIMITPSNKEYLRLADLQGIDMSRVCLICAMGINNETGAANDILAITQFAHENGVSTLVDCTQVVSYGGQYMKLGQLYPYATYMTFSAHKIYGPLGIGCLIARDTSALDPLIIGGSQELGLRGGTTNTPGVLAMSKAIHLMVTHDYSKKYVNLLIYLNKLIVKYIPEAYLNVWPSHANIVSLNLSHAINVDSLASLLANYDICVSAGSACDASHDETIGEFNGSHVLLAMGLNEQEIRNTVRLSFTKYTTKRELYLFIKTLKEIITKYGNQ